jgi:hypothetical protein
MKKENKKNIKYANLVPASGKVEWGKALYSIEGKKEKVDMKNYK